MPMPPSVHGSHLTGGHLLIAISLVFFVFASYAVLFSAFFPLTGIHVSIPFFVREEELTSRIQFLDVLAQDSHYKYFVLLFIPTTSYFVIANWVGWQYYRNS